MSFVFQKTGRRYLSLVAKNHTLAVQESYFNFTNLATEKDVSEAVVEMVEYLSNNHALRSVQSKSFLK